jgi:glycogen(starch) synthase
VDRLFNKSDSLVIPNGVDASAFLVDAAERDGIRTGYSNPLIVHTGRLEWEKGAHTLIEALPRIRRAFPGVQCVIAGRGSQSQALRDLARRKRVSGRVHMPGWLPESELRALVAAADVAVVPSIYEPFGIVALEAAGVQTPVVAAQSGGLAEFLAAEAHGYGFTAGDPVDLARAVHECLADPDGSAARAAQAYACVRDEHRWDVIAERTVEEYSRVRRKNRRAERAASSAADLPLDGNLLFEAT